MQIQQFIQIAAAHGARKITEFNQRNYINIKGFPIDTKTQNGVCRALSAAYLFRNFTKAMSKFDESDDSMKGAQMVETVGSGHFFQVFQNDIRHDASDKDMRRMKFINNVHARYQQEGPLQESDCLNAAKETISKISFTMMAYRSHSRVCTGGAGVTPDKLPDEQGFWLISGGRHMVAAVVRKKEFGLTTKAKFFDPNCGQAVFGDIANLRSFLNDFLNADGLSESLFIRCG